MKERKTTWFSKCIFKAVRWLVRLFYGKTDVVGIENLPEKDETNNNILNKFQENFIDVARFYYKKTGIELTTFMPMYVTPKLKKMYIGKGMKFNSQNDFADERTKISQYLADEITEIARNLPEHIVIPYRNIPKKNYLTNKDITEVPQ